MEQLVQVGWGNADTGVCHGKVNLSLVRVDAYVQVYASLFGGEFDRVAEQVDQYLLEADGVGVERGVRLVARIANLDLFLGGYAAYEGQAGSAHVVDDHDVGVEFELAGFDLGQVEQVVDQVQQVAPARLDVVHRAAPAAR